MLTTAEVATSLNRFGPICRQEGEEDTPLSMQDIRVCAHNHCWCERTHVSCDLFVRAYIVHSTYLESTCAGGSLTC